MGNRKGFTIIELVLSIGIIGIIAVSFLSIFGTGFSNIVRAGVRTKAVNTAESEFHDNPEIINEDDIDIELPIVGGTVKHTISGSYAKGVINVNNGKPTKFEVEIQAFVPGLFKDSE